jgi:hypothetical protein
MGLKIKQYADLSGPLLHYAGEVTLRFSPKAWLYLRETPEGLVPVYGVTKTLKIVDKPALVPWAVKKAVARAYEIIREKHGRGDGFVECTAEDLMEALLQAKREPEDILEAAGDTGHAAHYFVEDLIDATLRGDENRRLEILAKFPQDERATNCVIAALCFFVEHDVKFISSEQRVYSRELNVAGTLDGDILASSCQNLRCGCQIRAPFKDLRICLDMKTSNYVYNTHFAQAGFYRFAKCEEFPDVKFDGTVILRMGKDDLAQFEPWWSFGDEEYGRHVTFFKRALALYQSVFEADRWMWEIRDRQRAYDKGLKDVAKAEQAKVRCPKAAEYKGSRITTCLPDGTQCDACSSIYKKRHQ